MLCRDARVLCSVSWPIYNDTFDCKEFFDLFCQAFLIDCNSKLTIIFIFSYSIETFKTIKISFLRFIGGSDGGYDNVMKDSERSMKKAHWKTEAVFV